MPLSNPQIDIVARTAWGEARGDGLNGMHAVINVIYRRAGLAAAYVARDRRPHPLFGIGTPASACEVPWQFSCWNAGDPNRTKLLSVGLDDPRFVEAVGLARIAWNSGLADITHGSDSYFANDIPLPSWAAGLSPRARIGSQTFYCLYPGAPFRIVDAATIAPAGVVPERPEDVADILNAAELTNLNGQERQI
jgi:N-acetylmuramoyl-L-alanine amidase